MGFFLVGALLLTSVDVDATRPPPHMLDLYDSSKAGITSKRPPPRPGRPAGRGWRTAMRVLATGTIRSGVRLEFPILSLTPGLGTVAWRLTSARRGLAHEGPPAHPASPSRHDREAVWPRWRASGDRGAFSAQAAADRRAPLRGGASHEAVVRAGWGRPPRGVACACCTR